jgi:hypothetical protein
VEAAPVSPAYAGLAEAVADDADVLPYLDAAARDDFVALVTDLPVRWISQEGPGVLPDVAARLPEPPDAGENRFLLARDGEPLAWTRPHGGQLDWLPAAARPA